MPTFEVRFSPAALHAHQGKGYDVVTADYYKVEFGALVFRMHKPGSDQYPKSVKTFAPGMWIDVQEEPAEYAHDRAQHIRDRIATADGNQPDHDLFIPCDGCQTVRNCYDFGCDRSRAITDL